MVTPNACGTYFEGATYSYPLTQVAELNGDQYASNTLTVTSSGSWNMQGGYSATGSSFSANGSYGVSNGTTTNWSAYHPSTGQAIKALTVVKFEKAEYYSTCTGYFWELWPVAIEGGANWGSQYATNNDFNYSQVVGGSYGNTWHTMPQTAVTRDNSAGWTWSGAFDAFGFSGSVTEEWASNEMDRVFDTAAAGSGIDVAGYDDFTSWRVTYVTNSTVTGGGGGCGAALATSGFSGPQTVC